jgi:hypothetical protein
VTNAHNIQICIINYSIQSAEQRALQSAPLRAGIKGLCARIKIHAGANLNIYYLFHVCMCASERALVRKGISAAPLDKLLGEISHENEDNSSERAFIRGRRLIFAAPLLCAVRRPRSLQITLIALANES